MVHCQFPVRRCAVAAVTLIAAAVFFGAAIGTAAQAQFPSRAQAAGNVAYFKVANSAFDPYIDNPDSDERAWMLAHYARMKGWSPRFDQELGWYSTGWFYKDAYAIKPDSDTFAQNPEWVLRDAAGNLLNIPFDCSGGVCPQYAGDFGNPAFRAYWIAQAQETMAQGYIGLWIDDVNMTWRVSDGYENHVTPMDPRTGAPMLLEDWRRYMAEFVEQVRAALPAAEIAHNIIWYAADRENTNPYVRRQIDAADFINLERGVTDRGLTGGNGRYALTTFLEFIDFVHARGSNVILLDEATTTVQRQYALAGWLAISNGADLMGSENTQWSVPDNWWSGFDLNLGAALAPRYTWQTLIRRDFACGMVLLNPPDRANVQTSLERSWTTLEGATINAINLAGDNALILLDECAGLGIDADDDGVADTLDNCTNAANPLQRDSDADGYGNLCDADLNNDCVVNTVDLALLRTRMFSSDADADFNGDGQVNVLDLGLMRAAFFRPPGPATVGASCAAPQ